MEQTTFKQAVGARQGIRENCVLDQKGRVEIKEESGGGVRVYHNHRYLSFLNLFLDWPGYSPTACDEAHPEACLYHVRACTRIYVLL